MRFKRQPVKSPCVNICRMNGAGLCEGCLRTAAEIRAWKNASEPEKLAILAEVRKRRGKARWRPEGA